MTDTTPAESQAPAAQPGQPQPPPPPDRESITEHTATIDGRKVPYSAAAGTYTMKTEDDKPKATVFYVAYTRTEVKDPGLRPITFAFNGGPGSSSVWLHLGLLGPRRIDIGDAQAPPPPPYRVTDNRYSLLDRTDLVFIDPVSTGYSRAVSGEDPHQFHGVVEDVAAVADFIRLHTSRARRWESPKFLAGESYGTTRAAAMSGHLQDRHGMYLNGIVLISSILMFQTSPGRPVLGNDLPYALVLPTYAATAWYHRRLERRPRSVKALTDEVENFALTDYSTFLLKGAQATEEEQDEVAQRLAEYTGLSPEFIQRANHRIAPHRFFKELLRDQRRTIGRLDTRFSGIDADAAGEQPEYDPSYNVIQGPYSAAINHYVRADLNFESDLVYEALNGEAVRPWKFGEVGESHYLEVASTLRQAMSKNRNLMVFLASGYFDLATPYFAAEWTLDHMGLDPSLQGNITTSRYEAGHMMYVHEPSIRDLRERLTKFIESATKRGG
jgi:carboxypeptidase C (cathepsin A)